VLRRGTRPGEGRGARKVEGGREVEGEG